ncbi:MAG: glutamyl-tRNA amidotransferase [Firmicutes bacterium ML8_F2]|jgi:aspartyl-tRNA(Asn)/glutamyl-tRNA(Gln) amidotransferase subunit B|nr:MAG: glutamyl-tRNA amidotransferase [Firmicutes bacterium ML8_F2]
MEFETVIGLEIHLELQTRSKLFCSCSTAFGSEPNTSCCPVCLGLPGSLPVLNRKAVELAIIAALSLQSEIQKESRFDRKNYYYPDLPKAYQISQYDRPLALGGFIEMKNEGVKRKINLERIHIEEDPGKLIHSGESILDSDYSLVDYNRAGIPLLEIVTKPDLRSGREARLFLEELRCILLYSGSSDCRMEQGSLRCDANISLRPAGSKTLGTRTEVKNMNSFRAVEMALDYEAGRQAAILSAGGSIIQQTCHWDEENRKAIPLRGKEGSSDYRYFPEPDLLPLILKSDYIETLAANLPELPSRRRIRLMEEYDLDPADAVILTENRSLGDLFEVAAGEYKDYRNLARWVRGDLLYLLKGSDRNPSEVVPSLLIELLTMLDEGEINRPVAKNLLANIVKNGTNPRELLQQKGLGRIANREKLQPVVEKVLAENKDAVESIQQGREKAFAFLVGKVMAATAGRADPEKVQKLLRELIN